MFDIAFDFLVARGYTAQREAAKERANARRLCDHLVRFRPAGSARRPELTSSEPTVLRTDAEGIIVEPNGAAARWLKVPAQRLVGMPLLHLVHRRDTAAFRAIVKGLGYPGPDRAATVRFRPRGGAPELVHASVQKIGVNAFAWTLRPVARVMSPGQSEAETPAPPQTRERLRRPT